VGEIATNKLAYVDYLDANGAPGTRDFPIPVITVRTPTPRPSITATPSPPAFGAYLPAVHRGYCKPGRPFDVALVLDTSSSMWGVNLNRTREAAREFLVYLEMPPSRAAVLAFHDRAVVVQSLTGDRAVAQAALDRLPQGEGTRIDLALAEATRLLTAGDRDPTRQPVVVLITDGQLDGGTEQAALDAGAAARLAGVAVYAIAFGADADPRLLERIAGSPDRFFNAPGPDDLLAIYVGIAGDLPCGYGP